jgi:arginine decarboxylase
MKNTYFDLVDQTFYFPQEGFTLQDNSLHFHGIDLHALIKKYGTPLKITYLPKISQQIQKAKKHFNDAIDDLNYNGEYFYCYCTKSSHFRFVLDEVLKNNVQIETSSAFDIDLVHKLWQAGKANKDITIVCNGFKDAGYIRKIAFLVNSVGFTNVIPICDNRDEFDMLNAHIAKTCNIGIRVATEEEPNFQFYTSRLGIRHTRIVNFVKDKILTNPKFKLKMLHFFVDTGIKDNTYYWSELRKAIKLYCQLKHFCPDLDSLNIGGGLPIANSLNFEYDYGYMIKEIVRNIKEYCDDDDVPCPNIYTEFGKYTVGESGATILGVIGQKQQNDSELWYMVDNSLITTIPDAWAINERYIMLPINHWNKEYTRVNIGGLSCDNADYYNSEAHLNMVYLPKFSKSEDPLCVGFFNTGAYQDALSGFGGIKHCLLPSPKRVLVDKDENGNYVDWMESDEQDAEAMLRLLGY